MRAVTMLKKRDGRVLESGSRRSFFQPETTRSYRGEVRRTIEDKYRKWSDPVMLRLPESARREGFKGLVSGSAASALSMIKEHQPSVISLDIFLPDMQGWRILDRLKADLSTRHIPVCVVSTDDSRDRALNSGAIGFIAKPVGSGEVIEQAMEQLKTYVSRPRRKLALLMPRGAERDAIAARLKPEEVDVVAFDTSAAVCKALREQQVDCLVVRNGSGDLQPADLVDILEQQAVTRQLPIVMYGAEDTGTLSRWKRGDGVFALREARSTERLLDTIYFFLHRSILGLACLVGGLPGPADLVLDRSVVADERHVLGEGVAGVAERAADRGSEAAGRVAGGLQALGRFAPHPLRDPGRVARHVLDAGAGAARQPPDGMTLRHVLTPPLSGVRWRGFPSLRIANESLVVVDRVRSYAWGFSPR